jgi:hypothetical protein
MMFSWISRGVTEKKSAPRVRGAVVLFRNLAGMPFVSSAFFVPVWKEEVRDRLRNIRRMPLRQKGNGEGVTLLLSLLGIVTGEAFFLRQNRTAWEGVMVNGREHIQIFAEGSTLRFGSFWEAVDFWDNEIEREVDYAYDPGWGYLTSSLSLLGSGCQVYLWIHLPALSFIYGEEKLLQWLKDNRDLTVKGLGKNGEIYAHVFEISNRFTLGVSEWDVVRTIETLAIRVFKWEQQARFHFGDSPSRMDSFWEKLEDLTQEMFRKDDNMEKGVFDFLSLWFLGEEKGIIGEDGGLQYREVANLTSAWLVGDAARRNRVEALKILGVWPRRILNHV